MDCSRAEIPGSGKGLEVSANHKPTGGKTSLESSARPALVLLAQQRCPAQRGRRRALRAIRGVERSGRDDRQLGRASGDEHLEMDEAGMIFPCGLLPAYCFAKTSLVRTLRCTKGKLVLQFPESDSYQVSVGGEPAGRHELAEGQELEVVYQWYCYSL